MSAELDVETQEMQHETQRVTNAFLSVLSRNQNTRGAAIGACVSIIGFSINQACPDLDEAMYQVDLIADELRRVVAGMHDRHRAMVEGQGMEGLA
jgi:hypothetical protein